MQNYMTSSVVGGRDGYIFNDIVAVTNEGDFLVDDYNKNALDKRHPIQRITISSGWIVDGIAVTYQLAKGDNVTLCHGSQWAKPTAEVTLNAFELLVGVFGRVGKQRGMDARRDWVISIGFVLCNFATGDIRKVGPFGNSNNTNDGVGFYTSDVLAFGGFAQNTDHVGLSGLFFFKDLSRQQPLIFRTTEVSLQSAAAITDGKEGAVAETGTEGRAESDDTEVPEVDGGAKDAPAADKA